MRSKTLPLGWVCLCVLLASCQPSQAWQDAADQAELRRLFHIPAEAELVSYQGFPVMVGFGQREGLALSAVYRLTAEQLTAFTAQAAGWGWQTLPLAPEVRSKIRWQDPNLPLTARSGLYLCRTAGDAVLHASQTRACADTPVLNDLIFGVLQLPEGLLIIAVRAAY